MAMAGKFRLYDYNFFLFLFFFSVAVKLFVVWSSITCDTFFLI